MVTVEVLDLKREIERLHCLLLRARVYVRDASRSIANVAEVGRWVDQCREGLEQLPDQSAEGDGSWECAVCGSRLEAVSNSPEVQWCPVCGVLRHVLSDRRLDRVPQWAAAAGRGCCHE